MLAAVLMRDGQDAGCAFASPRLPILQCYLHTRMVTDSVVYTVNERVLSRASSCCRWRSYRRDAQAACQCLLRCTLTMTRTHRPITK